jgi:predicted AAA+ superfamily ATPase
VASEVRKQLGWSAVDADLFHFRDRSGIEVDLVLETRDGRVAGIEVKGSGTVRSGDLRGLRVLADRLGDRFAGGVVLYTGQQAVPFGERLAAVPLAALWETP